MACRLHLLIEHAAQEWLLEAGDILAAHDGTSGAQAVEIVEDGGAEELVCAAHHVLVDDKHVVEQHVEHVGDLRARHAVHVAQRDGGARNVLGVGVCLAPAMRALATSNISFSSCNT